MNDSSRLDYEYLGQEGFRYTVPNPEVVTASSLANCEKSIAECEAQEKLLGWLTVTLIGWLGEGLEGVIHGVRQAFAVIPKAIEGEADLTIQFTINDTDDAFFSSTPGPMSQWLERTRGQAERSHGARETRLRRVRGENRC